MPLLDEEAIFNVSAKVSIAQANTPVDNAQNGYERFLLMEWAPRWMNAYYDSDSYLKKIYFLSLYTPQQEMQALLSRSVVPEFYGPTGLDKDGFIVKYHHPEYHIPNIKFNEGAVSGTVINLATIGSLISNKTNPCYTRDDNFIYVKNLEIKMVNITTFSTVLDISSFDYTDDSYFIVENQWGDQLYFDPTDWRVDTVLNQLHIGFSGNITLYFKSKSKLLAYQNSTNYITIDDEKFNLSPYYFDNSWDSYAWIQRVSRHLSESNTHLKSRCQNLSLSKLPVQKISASLGQSQAFQWGTGTDFNLAGSGVTSFNLPEFPDSLYVDEFPERDGTNFILSYPPTGYVQLFFNTVKVEVDSYQVSGSLVIPLSNSLKLADRGQIKAQYRTQIYTTTVTNDLIVTISRETQGNEPVIGTFSKNVKVSNSTKKIKEWRWNSDLGKLSGLASFDF